MNLLSKVKKKVKKLTGTENLTELIRENPTLESEQKSLKESKDILIGNVMNRLNYMDVNSLQKHVDKLKKEEYKSFYSDLFMQLEKINYLEQKNIIEETGLLCETLEKQQKILKNKKDGDKSESDMPKDDTTLAEINELTKENKRLKENSDSLKNELQKQYDLFHQKNEKLAESLKRIEEMEKEREDERKMWGNKSELNDQLIDNYKKQIKQLNESLLEFDEKNQLLEQSNTEQNVLIEELQARQRKQKMAVKQAKKSLVKGKLISKGDRW